MERGGVLLCLAGDVMTGRGVDQILPSPGDPRVWEPHAVSAREYVALAERVSAPIPSPVDPAWPWGDALEVMDRIGPDLRLINLETSITTSDDAAPGKTVHYRMHPGNIGCLTVAHPDACALANNHVLDHGVRGLDDTLEALAEAGLAAAGAGKDAERAWRPLELWAGDRRVLFWSVGTSSSGVPATWAAGPARAGVAYLDDVDDLCDRVRRTKQPDDLAVVSIHMGSNWGYAVPRAQQELAHRLVESGADVVHGHSSHHPRPVEVYKERLVLYGCGDLINDYEGIPGGEQFRPDLRPLYFVNLDAHGRLDRLQVVPFEARQMRLIEATARDAVWLHRKLQRASRPFGTRIDLEPDGSLLLRR